MRKKRVAGAAILAGMAAILLVGCGGGGSARETGGATPGGGGAEAVRGVTANAIRIGVLTDQTGPASSVAKQIDSGVLAYIRRTNDAGGVHGRRIETVTVDNGYDPARGVAGAKRLIEREKVFGLYVLGSPVANAIVEEVDKGIPTVAASESSVLLDPPHRYLFLVAFPYVDQAAMMIDHIAGPLGMPKAKLAVVYADDAAGQDGLKGVRAAAEARGLPILTEVPIKAGTVDFATPVLNVKQADPDFVFVYTPQMALFIKEARRAGLRAQMVNGLAPVASQETIDLAGAEAAEGVWSVGARANWDAEGPGVEAMREAAAKYYPEIAKIQPSTFVWGWALGQVLVTGLEAAGAEPTPDAFVAGLEAKPVDTGGVAGILDYSGGKRQGQYEGFVLRVERGRWVQKTEWGRPAGK